MSEMKSKQKLSDRYSSSSGNSGKNPFLIIAILIGIIIVGTVTVTLFLGDGSGNGSNVNKGYNLVVTPDDIDEILEENASNKVAPGTYDVCMNSTWTFEDAKTPSKDAYVENLPSNTNTVSFVLKRNDTGEVIYESPYIPVGSRLANIKLDDGNLVRGTYPCTVTYRLYDADYTELSTVNIGVNVQIEND